MIVAMNINKFDLVNMLENKIFLSTHAVFQKVDHELGNKGNINTYQ